MGTRESGSIHLKSCNLQRRILFPEHAGCAIHPQSPMRLSRNTPILSHITTKQSDTQTPAHSLDRRPSTLHVKTTARQRIQYRRSKRIITCSAVTSVVLVFAAVTYTTTLNVWQARIDSKISRVEDGMSADAVAQILGRPTRMSGDRLSWYYELPARVHIPLLTRPDYCVHFSTAGLVTSFGLMDD